MPFNLITLQQTKHWAQYLQEFNATLCSKFSNINNPMHPMQAFVMKTLVTMRGKTITTLFMNVLKHSRCMEQSNPIVLLFRVVLKQLNQPPEIGGAINWSVWVVALHHYHHWSPHSLHGWLITSCSDLYLYRCKQRFFASCQNLLYKAFSLLQNSTFGQ